jgi:hypothetical protein
MPAFLRRLFDRSKERVNRTAVGTPVPAGLEPGQQRRTTARERTVMRRRLRVLRRRQATLAGEPAGPELEAVDAEIGALAQALAEKQTLDELLASGVSSRCEGCGELVATREHFCTNCGAQQGPTEPAAAAHAPAPRPAPSAAASTAVATGASGGRSPSPPAH